MNSLRKFVLVLIGRVLVFVIRLQNFFETIVAEKFVDLLSWYFVVLLDVLGHEGEEMSATFFGGFTQVLEALWADAGYLFRRGGHGYWLDCGL